MFLVVSITEFRKSTTIRQSAIVQDLQDKSDEFPASLLYSVRCNYEQHCKRFGIFFRCIKNQLPRVNPQGSLRELPRNEAAHLLLYINPAMGIGVQ